MAGGIVSIESPNDLKPAFPGVDADQGATDQAFKDFGFVGGWSLKCIGEVTGFAVKQHGFRRACHPS